MKLGVILCDCGNAKMTSQFECDQCAEKKQPRRQAANGFERMSDPAVILSLAKIASNLVKACSSVRVPHMEAPVSAAVDFLLNHRAEIEDAMKRAGASGMEVPG